MFCTMLVASFGSFVLQTLYKGTHLLTDMFCRLCKLWCLLTLQRDRLELVLYKPCTCEGGVKGVLLRRRPARTP